MRKKTLAWQKHKKTKKSIRHINCKNSSETYKKTKTKTKTKVKKKVKHKQN